MHQWAHGQRPVLTTEPISGEHRSLHRCPPQSGGRRKNAPTTRVGRRSLPPKPLVKQAGSDNSLQSFHPYLQPSWDYLVDSNSLQHTQWFVSPWRGEESLCALTWREWLSIVPRGSEMGTCLYFQRCLLKIVFSRVLPLVQMSRGMGSPFLQGVAKVRLPCTQPAAWPSSSPARWLRLAEKVSNRCPWYRCCAI